MKKLFIIVVSLAYLAVSSGVIVNLHYCMNRLASTGFFDAPDKQCGKCGMDIHQSDGCCHDETQFLKIQDDQKNTAAFSFDLTGLEVPAIKPSEFICALFVSARDSRHFLNHSPPLLSSQDSYLQNSVFRI